MDAQNSGHTPSLEMAYVLFMDIVAYSTLRMEEQQSVLSRFQEAVRNTTEFARARAEDRLIRLPTGDGMALVFFWRSRSSRTLRARGKPQSPRAS
jgi:hypothetical protein